MPSLSGIAPVVALLLALSAVTVQTADTTTALIAPSVAASGVAPGPNTNGYTYQGCFNETTGITGSGGVRALPAGMIATNNLTTASCLSFCANASYDWCGMEYGRECWGAPNLNSLSKQLDESNCSLACEGNASEICGGDLVLSLYNLTGEATTKPNSPTKKTSSAARTVVAITSGTSFGLWSSAVMSGLVVLFVAVL